MVGGFTSCHRFNLKEEIIWTATERSYACKCRGSKAVVQSPQRSARKHATALRLCDGKVRRILHLDLKFHPYKMAVVQELHAGDWENRVNSCQHILASVPPTAVLLTSDEAHVHLSGCVNKQNFRYWAGTNPKELHERSLHSERVTVWCAVAEFGVCGPYFFEKDGHAVTVTSARYVEMLQNFLQPRLNKLAVDAEDIWFQQDGATAHTARLTMDLLRGLFPGHIISHCGDIPWPARLPDLARCNFFLWGHLKAEVYKHRPHTLDELQTAIREEIVAIPPDMTARVMNNFRKRLNVCIRSQGRHMDDIVSTNKLHVLANLKVTIKFGFDEALPILLPCEIHLFFLTHK